MNSRLIKVLKKKKEERKEKRRRVFWGQFR